jgi:hypothetical protein
MEICGLRRSVKGPLYGWKIWTLDPSSGAESAVRAAYALRALVLEFCSCCCRYQLANGGALRVSAFSPVVPRVPGFGTLQLTGLLKPRRGLNG